MFMFADILLPLAAPGAYTYLLPPALEERAKAGCRVVVPFGVRRRYTGLILRLHNDAPADGVKLKSVEELLDEQPVVNELQLRLWQWMASYYMCTEGEVLKAALPSGLKPSSETIVARRPDFADDGTLSPRDAALLAALPREGGISIADLEKAMKRSNLLPAVRRLLSLGAAEVMERMTAAFKPRRETRCRLAEHLFDETALNDALDALRRAPAQEKLLLRYLDLSSCATALSLKNYTLLQSVSKQALTQGEAGSDAAYAALRRRGFLESFEVETERLTAYKAMPSALTRQLSEAQQKACDEIRNAWQEKEVCLLHGVTSSGKTEVYINLIREVLAAGGQVLYLVPEIALTTQLTARLGRVFGEQMGVYHSKFPDAERVELWQRQLSPRAFPLILGVRSSLFLPFANLRLIIVDEEHETSYKQQDPAPRYNARDAAIVLARFAGAKVLLGTATPAIETYRNAETGKYGLVTLRSRFSGVPLPAIAVADVKELRRKKLMKTPLSPALLEETRAALGAKEQVILFQNRRGYAPVLECHTCGWTPRCQRCDVTLTFHQNIHRLVCHYCGATYAVPSVCPACGGTELRDIGCGTEKIEAVAKACFPEARIGRMDLDTTRSRTAYERIIDDFQHRRTDILIGTQMVTKGLDFDNVHVVGILNADQMLSQPDFRAHERSFQMMSQVAGRAGRRGKQGLVILQTRQPDLPVIDQVVRGDYEGMYRTQLAERRAFRFPPEVRLINIFLRHRKEAVCESAAAHYARLLQTAFSADDLMGPDRPGVARVHLMYIRKLMLKLPAGHSPARVRSFLLSAREQLLSSPTFKGVDFYFDVDPL